MKFALKLNQEKFEQQKYYKYYKYDRCGYVSIIKDSNRYGVSSPPLCGEFI